MMRHTDHDAATAAGRSAPRWAAALASGLLFGLLAVHPSGGATPGESTFGVPELRAQSDGDETETKAPGDMSAEEVAKRIQKYYKKTEDFQASFKQVYRDVAAGEKKVNWGKVYFKKPGKMRWDYYESKKLGERKKTLVSDGDLFWIYELEFKQVFKQCLEESQLPTSLKFLMGQGNLLEDFDVRFSEDSSSEAPELVLKPKKPTPKYKKVHFQVDPETFRIDQTTVFDPYGNTNAIDFRNTKLNQNLPNSGFEFEPPEGARLLNPEKDCE